MFNSDIIFGVQMWLDNTVPCDQHVWQFKQKLLCNPFSNLTSRMKSLINFAKRHNTDIDWLCIVVQLPVTCISMYSCNHSNYSTSKTCICWWIINPHGDQSWRLWSFANKKEAISRFTSTPWIVCLVIAIYAVMANLSKIYLIDYQTTYYSMWWGTTIL